MLIDRDKNTLFIYYDIGQPDDRKMRVNAEMVQYGLAELDNSEPLHIRINSTGGSMTEGEAINAAIRAFGAPKVVTHIDGIAASMAFSIAMEGDKDSRYIQPTGTGMLHMPTAGTVGTGQQIQNYGAYVQKMGEAYAAKIAAKCDKEPDAVLAAMQAETWLVGQQAVDAGYMSAIEPEGSRMESEQVQALIPDALVAKIFPQKHHNKPNDTMPELINELASTLNCDAKQSVVAERVSSLQSRAALVADLEAKVKTIETAKDEAEKNASELSAKLRRFEIADLQSSIADELGVTLPKAQAEAFERRAERYLAAQDETVKADLHEDMKTFVKAHGVKTGPDASLAGAHQGDRQDPITDPSALLDKQVKDLQAKAKANGSTLPYTEALKTLQS